MKIRKYVSAAKDAANKKNVKESTGPHRGNKFAKNNALTHGFFPRELVLNDEEKRQFETLRRSLHPQLSPNSVMQELEFGLIMSCIGRCKLALRSEMRHVRRAFDGDTVHQAQRDQPLVPDPLASFLYRYSVLIRGVLPALFYFFFAVFLYARPSTASSRGWKCHDAKERLQRTSGH
ncbi:MAG: hypothetical protein WB711_16535 [Terriglobales bacterium]